MREVIYRVEVGQFVVLAVITRAVACVAVAVQLSFEVGWFGNNNGGSEYNQI